MSEEFVQSLGEITAKRMLAERAEAGQFKKEVWEYLDSLWYHPEEFARMIATAEKTKDGHYPMQVIVLHYLSERGSPRLKEQVKKHLDDPSILDRDYDDPSILDRGYDIPLLDEEGDISF